LPPSSAAWPAHPQLSLSPVLSSLPSASWLVVVFASFLSSSHAFFCVFHAFGLVFVVVFVPVVVEEVVECFVVEEVVVTTKEHHLQEPVETAANLVVVVLVEKNQGKNLWPF